jgi:transposase-like protein
MPMNKYDPKIKEEILQRIKTSGKPVMQVANEYGINVKSVYSWLRSGVTQPNPILEINRLKRQNEELIKLIGELTFDLKKKR